MGDCSKQTSNMKYIYILILDSRKYTSELHTPEVPHVSSMEAMTVYTQIPEWLHSSNPDCGVVPSIGTFFP